MRETTVSAICPACGAGFAATGPVSESPASAVEDWQTMHLGGHSRWARLRAGRIKRTNKEGT